ncbi:MAG: AAA domain-containing protein [Candidatus Nitrotoga sp.]|nr:AAA domain-containing protein [Candidatus Nitrotoga sp.]
MTECANRLIKLLDYIEQIEKLKRKPAYTVPEDIFVAYQDELKGLPGVEFNIQCSADDIWLRVPRLKEIPAPELDDKLNLWVTLSKSPDKPPELKAEIPILEGKKEIGKQTLKDYPGIQTAFAWYLKELWEPWAAAERPRRKTVNFYNKLFALEQAIATEGSETPIELIWGLGLAVWKPGSTAVKHPLISQPCEIVLNVLNFDLEIRPRDTDARLELDCYADLELAGVRPLEDYWKSFQATAANRANPFEASTFEGTLKAAVAHLNGSYLASDPDPKIPTANDKLVITDTWVIFGRRRSDHIFVQDIQRLKKNLATATSIPAVIRGFVEEGDPLIRARAPVSFRGLSSSTAGQGVKELYFPMPYNEEQISIVEKLETNDGVVVQGPPGTGKTHTIANIICHFLAQGKRVLVTAKGESALAVLQDKLPIQIQPLSVSLLTDERGGMKQFEHSIQTIATNVSALNPAVSERQIATLEARLNALHAKISFVDQSIGAYAEKHMRHYPFQGRDASPEELARFVLENEDTYSWLDDELNAKANSKINFGDSDISSLRQARIQAGNDIPYLNCFLPTTDNFPAWTDILTLHKDLLKAKEIEASVTDGNILALVDSTNTTFENAKAFAILLSAREALARDIQIQTQAWTKMLSDKLAVAKLDDPAHQGFLKLLDDIDALETVRRQILANAVTIPTGAETHKDFAVALGRMLEGKSPFVLPFGKQEARIIVSAITIAGLQPSTKDDWQKVATHIQYLLDSWKAVARWNAIAPEFGVSTVPANSEESFRILAQWQLHIKDIQKLITEFDTKLPRHTEAVFGQRVVAKLMLQDEELLSLIQASLYQHIDKGRLAYGMRAVSELLGKLQGKSGEIVEQLRQFFNQKLGSEEVPDATLQELWHDLMAEVRRLSSLHGAFLEITRVTSLVESSGAVRWANRLRTSLANEQSDSQTPSDWLEAWNWRIAHTFLEQIDGHHKLKSLFDERRTLESDLSKTYQELIAEKTWLGVYNNSPVSIRQALQAYLGAIQAMGAGTGIRAVRFRRDARTAMLAAYKAVPCWVMPQWRVSEALPPEIGLFDLVVIDEASQSDIWALPALLRGKKLLVVGDHKQVSPSTFTAEVTIQNLINRFLQEQPHGAQMTPDKSIYDLARVVFAGNSVMLREHFRCVPAIIEFSNREFYKGDIKPLRLPKASERLDPPLVDVFVKGGYRKGDVNDPEARAIINEIKAILEDATLVGRTIGIVTLLGTEQAAHITKLLNTEITPADIVARKIAVGAPPMFQGRERDIMLVSMVLAPGNPTAASRLDIEQRFNVALSRARDRTYLFRSVNETDFQPDTLTARLIRHFRQPFTQNARQVAALRDRCESGFEREVFDFLTQRNFRVEPQVKCGGYFIDFVVEGAEGRRLAVECDGDRFHGPGQWPADMARQRVLERAGWTFWRCFASSFVMRREQVVADLLATLEKMGIAPLGSESVDNTVWVRYKEVDPYDLEAVQEPAEEAVG